MFDPEAIDRVRTERQAWEARELTEFVGRQPEARSEYRTGSGLPVQRIYTPEDVADTPWSDIGWPGRWPFTRGPYPTMYRGRLWTMRQIAGFGTGEDTNGRFKYLIAQGQTGLSCDFDMPTLMGYDSDDPRSLGEVGREGVAVDTIEDVEALFAGIDLETISVSMTINPTAWILLAMYIAVAQARGFDLNRLSGTVQADILKEYVAQKEWIFPIRPSLRLMRDMIVFCAERMARYNPVNISGYHISEAGATSVQEVAFTMANGIAYVEEVIRSGVAVDAFAPRLAFYFVAPLGGSYYVEALTTRIEREVLAILKHVDEMGGTVAAIEAGWFQREIADSAYAFARRKASGDAPVIGVNKYVEPAAAVADMPIHRVPPETEARQVARLRAVRARRDEREVAGLLDRLAQAASDPAANLMEPTIALVRARASMGEIVNRLRNSWGSYVEKPVF